ncbi:related to UPF0592 protein YDL073W [Zygosaccharomyces bailii ISA1307]|nr:related to UPF0592 protein YDL073W [Zygosaccharomyces bailii ISA1307]
MENPSGIDYGPDIRLFQALNGFIQIVSDDMQNDSETGPRSDSKTVANYLRLKLLSYLRQLQLQDEVTSYRDVLIQWWVTLLNFLNSDLVQKNSSTDEMVFPNQLLNVDSISVSLECMSRLLSALMVLPVHSCKDAEIYSHHVLLTIHYVTNRLILNSKHTREQQQQQQNLNRPFLHFLSTYTSLLRSFLGKLNAFAFFYLPDDFHYDTQLLLALKPNLNYKPANSLFLWKRRAFGSAENSEDRIQPETLENRDTKFFKIVISYMKNDFIFMGFYWHYWYIALRFLAFLGGSGMELKANLSQIPGATVLISHATSGFLRIDLGRFAKFLQTNNPTNAGSSRIDSNDNLPIPNIAVASANENSMVTKEALNNFLFSNFRILRVWECLRSLSGCLEKDVNLPVLLSLHDTSQLRYISKVPAHDSSYANVIYNKIFQFIIFQYRSLPTIHFLHWDIWFAGVSAMLHTLNNNSQTIALLFLFNVWPYIPSELQSTLSNQLIDEYWDSLTVDSDFQLVRVLFLKLLVFRIVPGADNSLREQIKGRFQAFYAEMLVIKFKFKEEPTRDKEGDLYFYGSKRLFLAPNKALREQDLIYAAEKHSRYKAGESFQNFPSVISVANVRPSLILKNGRYPYDVFDEMVSKATLLMAEKKRREQNSLPVVGSASSNPQTGDSEGVTRRSSSKKSGSISTTINSWFSKFSKHQDQSPPLSTTSSMDAQSQSSPSLTNGNNLRSEKGKFPTGEENTPFSESSEMLSMYSTVSSIGTKQTNSSEAQLSSSGGQPPGSGVGLSSGKEPNSNGVSRDSQRKKKLLAPVELKYSSLVSDTEKFSTVFKVMISPAESMGRKIERANTSWGVVTARTYSKPLPLPLIPPTQSSAVDSVIDELNNDFFGMDCLSESSLEFSSSQDGNQNSNESTLMSSISSDPTVPKPNYKFFGVQNSEDSEISTGDSDLLSRFQNFAFGKDDEVEADEETILQVSATFDEQYMKARRKALFRNKQMSSKTKLNKLSKIVRMFNKTVEEYYEYFNFLNHDSIFMEFEIRPPSHTNMINISGD